MLHSTPHHRPRLSLFLASVLLAAAGSLLSAGIAAARTSATLSAGIAAAQTSATLSAGVAAARTSATGSGSETGPVRSGAVVTLRWTPMAGASGYEVVEEGARAATVTRPLSHVTVERAHRSEPGAVQVWETSGYQPLGSVAGSGAFASGTGAALLSPLSSLALSGVARVATTTATSTRLAAGTSSAAVKNGTGQSVRYGVVAIVHGAPRRVSHVSAASVVAESVTPASTSAPAAQPTIYVDSSETYQTVQGFGATLSDSSAYELAGGTAGASPATLMTVPGLTDLFSPKDGIGLSYVRVSIGGNDFSQANYAESPSLHNEYTENDPAPGSTATAFTAAQLSSFISHDLEYQVPVLKAAVALNPSLKIMAAPWTAPVWMKCENTAAESGAACQTFDPTDLQAILSGNPGYAGGTLNPAFVSQYADYLLEFILAYKAQGLTVDAVSLGNEPANGTWSYPSMEISPQVEAEVAGDLTSDMKAAGVHATIIGLDHNWNTTYPQRSAESCGSDCYATQLVDDAKAGTVGAIGFHCYGGDPSAQDDVTLPIYETECAPLGGYTTTRDSGLSDLFSTTPSNFAEDLLYDTQQLVMNGMRDGDTGGVSGAGSQTVMLWDMVANSNYGPTINIGCTTRAPSGACLPVEELDNPSQPTYEVGYYLLGQLSRFIQPGAVRIGSSESGDLETVAFANRDGKDALVVLNDQSVDCSALACAQPSSSQAFTVDADGATFTGAIPPGAVQTYVWKG